MNIHEIVRRTALLAASAALVAGCSGGRPESDTGDEEAPDEAAQASSPTASSCRTCAPPFFERPGEQEFSGQLVVRPVQGASAGRDARARARISGLVLRRHPEVDEYILRVPAGKMRGDGENSLAAALMETGDYEYATPNWRLFTTAVPNDPQYGNQWHLPKIQAPKAWDLQRGAAAVLIAFTDTGIDTTHPDLGVQRLPGFNAVSELAEADGGDVSDVLGHGTHVAGCAAAMGNNAVGVSGVGWALRLMMVRVTNAPNGSAYLDDITQGARWAAENGAKVVSSSYAGVSSPAVQTTGNYLRSLGALYMYSAGNNGATLGTFDHPDVVVVGATDASDGRASFSAYGPALDVFAPGVSILSTLKGGGYGYMSGTSMAAPIAAGVAAMIWSVNPEFTPAQVETFLSTGARDLGQKGNDSTFGWGRVNVNDAVIAARASACYHSTCVAGGPLGNGCDTCTASICSLQPSCCTTAWDAQCVEAVAATCGAACP